MGGLETKFAADAQKEYLSGLDVKLIEACMQKAKREDETKPWLTKKAREAVMERAGLYVLGKVGLIYLRGQLNSGEHVQPEEVERATNQASHNYAWLLRYSQSNSLLATMAYFALTKPTTWRPK